MEKNKSFYMTLVVLVCSLFAFLGAFYLGTYFSVGKEVIKENNGFNTKGGIKEVINIPDYNYYMSTLLYNYLNNNKDKLNFNDYINKGITNNQKLYIAGIFGTSKFNDLEENLNKIFGSTLNLKPDDYYSWPSDEQPVYKYNKETNMYDYNDDVIGTDVLTDLLDSYIYNYKIKSVEYNDNGFIVTYYGLYAHFDSVGPTCVTNNSNIERYLGYDSTEDRLTDEYYLSEAFNKNKDDFFKFTYTYKKVNKNYVLIDFKQE